MHHSKIKLTKPKPMPHQLPRIKRQILNDVQKHLETHKQEVAKLNLIDSRTKIAGEFFDDFLSDRTTAYIPIDLKDILDLCREEPNIVGEVSRTSNTASTTLTIIKDAIRFYLKDYVYGRVNARSLSSSRRRGSILKQNSNFDIV